MEIWGETSKQNLAPYIWGSVAWFLIIFCSYSIKDVSALHDFLL